MIESITLGEILTSIGVIAGIIGGVFGLYKYFKKAVEKVLEEQFKAINKRLDDIEDNIKQKEIDACKDFLVRFLSDIERGAGVSEMEMQRFSERYTQYIEKYAQNGYIKDKVARLKEKGLL